METPRPATHAYRPERLAARALLGARASERGTTMLRRASPESIRPRVHGGSPRPRPGRRGSARRLGSRVRGRRRAPVVCRSRSSTGTGAGAPASPSPPAAPTRAISAPITPSPGAQPAGSVGSHHRGRGAVRAHAQRAGADLGPERRRRRRRGREGAHRLSPRPRLQRQRHADRGRRGRRSRDNVATGSLVLTQPHPQRVRLPSVRAGQGAGRRAARAERRRQARPGLQRGHGLLRRAERQRGRRRRRSASSTTPRRTWPTPRRAPRPSSRARTTSRAPRSTSPAPGASSRPTRGRSTNAYIQLAFLLNAPVSGPLVSPDATLAARRRRPARPTRSCASRSISGPTSLVDEVRWSPPRTTSPTSRCCASSPSSACRARRRERRTLPPRPRQWNQETLAATLTWTLYDAGARYADKHSRDAQADDRRAEPAAARAQRRRAGPRRGRAPRRRAGRVPASPGRPATPRGRTWTRRRSSIARGWPRRSSSSTPTTALHRRGQLRRAPQYTMAQAYLDLRQALGLDPLGTELK